MMDSGNRGISTDVRHFEQTSGTLVPKFGIVVCFIKEYKE